MPELPHSLNRTVVIQAKPETVFRFFTDSARWAAWWGAGSTIDPQPGGKVYIRHPNGIETVGEVLEIAGPESIAFTYGYASGKPIPPGASRVTIRLEPDAGGTRLHVLHEFDDASARDHHIQGWRFQLSLFGNAVANEVYANAAAAVDDWFRAWSVADDGAREQLLAGTVASGIRFRDRYSLLDGLAELTAHTGVAQRFMPGIRMERKGDVRHCQGTVLADWVAVDSGGNPRMSGTNVFVFGPDGKMESVTGFAS